jgi:hypothetical protein
MRTNFFVAAGLAGLLLAACDNAGDADQDRPIPPAEDGAAAPEGTSGEAAQDALGRASESARETMENLGEAGRAGIEALQENAPEIREGLNEAGERLRNAAGALTGDASDAPPLDEEGDSERDVNEVPEAQEPPAQ